jgi:hypothetical protein
MGLSFVLTNLPISQIKRWNRKGAAMSDWTPRFRHVSTAGM